VQLKKKKNGLCHKPKVSSKLHRARAVALSFHFGQHKKRNMQCRSEYSPFILANLKDMFIIRVPLNFGFDRSALGLQVQKREKRRNVYRIV